MASGLEAPATRAIGRVAAKLLDTARTHRRNERTLRDARPLVPARVAEGLLSELDETEIRRINGYLASPDFEEIALQFVLGIVLTNESWEQLAANIREELRHGLRHSVGLRTGLLLTATDVVFGALATAFNENVDVPPGYRFHPGMLAMAAHLTAVAAANSRLLCEIGSLAEFHEFARQLRAQAVAVHGHMRLPHLGVSRSVPYGQLYVEPVLRPEQEGYSAPELTALALPSRRSVILGDPGAGKSTLAAKLAHDVASDLVAGAEGRVPFLLVLRNFAGSFREGGKRLVHYLEQVCRDPYNLEPPPKAVDYLLRNGRAMVLLDGLDELVEPELRHKFVQLVHGFVNHYPFVPVLVTARRIGYSDAPLDRLLFTVGVVAELAEDQVVQYARRWFALDESTAEVDRARMARSFLAESKGISELRANPLLLALLCAMYSSEHYIPGNLAQVYERCAVMLFDRWDSMRGIAMPVQFQGRLRGAVQYLAWQLFCAEESGKAMPRHRIVRMLADHLVAKGFDKDEALATAEQFVEFCTGRAWILTDVGATETDPRYGFTHRTFLEYFAAEHLVRTRPTARQLWEALRPHVLSGEWEVVAQIALQLLDRNVDGGADALLRLVLAEKHDDLHQRSRVRGFAARALGYVHPGHDVISEVAAAALDVALEGEVRDRYHYWVGEETFNKMQIRDGALHTVMYGCLPGNLPAVRRTLTAVLDHRIESGSETARFLASRLSRHLISADERIVRIWQQAYVDIRRRHIRILVAWGDYTPWGCILGNTTADRIVTQFGPWPLYLADAFLTGSASPFAYRLIDSCMSDNGEPPDLTTLRDALMAANRPWISDECFWNDYSPTAMKFELAQVGAADTLPKGALAPVALLSLPYLEAAADYGFGPPLPEPVPLLARARRTGNPDLVHFLPDTALRDEERAFLVSWVCREFSVLGPGPRG